MLFSEREGRGTQKKTSQGLTSGVAFRIQEPEPHWCVCVGGGGRWMPSPLHPSIFQRYWIILTGVATVSFDPHRNVTTPSPRDNAQESASDWRVKRVHDNCIAVPIPGEILCKQVKLFIRTGYLNQWKNTKKGKRNRKLRASVQKTNRQMEWAKKDVERLRIHLRGGGKWTKASITIKVLCKMFLRISRI